MQKITPQQRQTHKRRQDLWGQVGPVLEAVGKPLTVMVSITWSACISAGPLPGNILGRQENERISIVWDRLRRVVNSHGEECWIAARAPEYDRKKALHLHMGLRLPVSGYRDTIQTLERLTGVKAHKVYLPDGATIRRHGRVTHGVLAIGEDGAWMVQRNLRAGSGGTGGLLAYAVKAPKSSQTQGQFRLSNDVKKFIRTQGSIPEQSPRRSEPLHAGTERVFAPNGRGTETGPLWPAQALYGRLNEAPDHAQAN